MKSLIVTTLSIALPMNSMAFTVSLPNVIGGTRIETFSGKTAGHEEITRQAIVLALATAKNSLPFGTITPREMRLLQAGIKNEHWGTLGYATENPIIRGNHSNDIPVTNNLFIPKYKKYIPELQKLTGLPPEQLGARSFWMWYNLDSPFSGLESMNPKEKAARKQEVYANMGGNWDYNYEFQTAHSLRDAVTVPGPNNTRKVVALKSARATCERTQSYLQNLAILAVSNLQKARELESQGQTQLAESHAYQGFFHLGQATHSLQDSFSPDHAKRGGANYDIKDICVYGNAYQAEYQNRVCYHFEYVPGTEGQPIYQKIKALAATAKEGLHAYLNGEMEDSIWLRGPEKSIHVPKDYVRIDVSEKERLTKDRWGKIEPVHQVEAKEAFIAGSRSKWSVIKDEARMARTATARYLYVILEYIDDIRQQPRPYATDDANYSVLKERLATRFFNGLPSRIKTPKKVTDGGCKRTLYRTAKLTCMDGDTEIDVVPLDQEMKDGAFRCDGLSSDTLFPKK